MCEVEEHRTYASPGNGMDENIGMEQNRGMEEDNGMEENSGMEEDDGRVRHGFKGDGKECQEE